MLYWGLFSYLLNVNNHVKSTIFQFQFLLCNRQCLVELGQGNMGWLSGATQIWIEEYLYLSLNWHVHCQAKSCPCSKACLTCLFLTNSHFCTSRQYMLLTAGRNSLLIFHFKSKNVICILGHSTIGQRCEQAAAPSSHMVHNNTWASSLVARQLLIYCLQEQHYIWMNMQNSHSSVKICTHVCKETPSSVNEGTCNTCNI